MAGKCVKMSQDIMRASRANIEFVTKVKDSKHKQMEAQELEVVVDKEVVKLLVVDDIEAIIVFVSKLKVVFKFLASIVMLSFGMIYMMVEVIRLVKQVLVLVSKLKSELASISATLAVLKSTDTPVAFGLELVV